MTYTTMEHKMNTIADKDFPIWGHLSPSYLACNVRAWKRVHDAQIFLGCLFLTLTLVGVISVTGTQFATSPFLEKLTFVILGGSVLSLVLGLIATSLILRGADIHDSRFRSQQ